MALKTIKELLSGVAVTANDLFISRQGTDTTDKSVTAGQIKDFVLTIPTIDTNVSMTITNERILRATVPVTITLPPTPVDGQVHEILHDSATGVITIDGNGRNVDGSPTYIIDTRYVNAKIRYYAGADAWFVF